ncbi:hypothetical protein COT03_02845 [Candidatus Shapirobacteria bacterium CG07_land_8_20_14_0_80_39_18]|uniref:Glycosyltransferase family 1 protein n=1 Tax=Candidatus Shapirobacteria bacterium CG07_land_8_20_14_0_80_39_18 TaxID=1974882 RepID=A0A2M6YQP4_9BACT|nr:MAG: hypothetical protein COT03_02845 [Candidatus Shapirobacteria bacterium CG07_land_8_20_14_0_80_39_18]
MFKDSEIRIGINIGKTGREDRGITVYTQNILREFGQFGGEYRFVLLHYPNSAPQNKFGISEAEFKSLSFSDKHDPWSTIVCEQLLNPWQQRELGLDVVWHPHNRGQFIVPVGYVLTMHDILPIVKPELAGQYLNRTNKKALYLSRTYSARRADAIITGSEFSKAEIIEHLGVTPDKVVVIHYGIDLDTFKPRGSQSEYERIRKAYSLPDRYLLTTGSYAPHKNIHTLVDAYNQSHLPGKGIGFVAVGPNDATGYRAGYNQLKEHVQSLGLTGKVKLLPSVPIGDLVAIYGGAEIFATASLYEGFGFTPLEAMACGVPVVASNVSAIPEVCGQAALYADPYDALGFAEHLSVLIEDEDMRQRLIKTGLSQVQRYNWQVTASKTLEVLKSVAIARK